MSNVLSEEKRCCAWKAHSAFHFSTATTVEFEEDSTQGLLRREGVERTVQRRVGKPGVDHASRVTEGFIRTDTRASSSSARRAILHQEAGYIYADYPFEHLQTSCSSTADHTLSTIEESGPPTKRRPCRRVKKAWR